MMRSLAAALSRPSSDRPSAAQSNMAHPEKFTAFAVNISNMTTRAQTAQVDVTDQPLVDRRRSRSADR